MADAAALGWPAVSTLPLRRLLTGDVATDRVVQGVATDLAPVLGALLTGAQEVEVEDGKPPFAAVVYLPAASSRPTRSVWLQTGAVNVIPHRLGKVPRGRFLTAQNVNATVWDVDVTPLGLSPARYLGLASSADLYVSVVVY